MMKYRYVESAIGDILIAGDKAGLKFIGFPTGKGKVHPGVDWQRDNEAFDDVRTQLNEYFAGERKSFDVRLAPHGTRFQLDVLRALQQIPYGETRSYRDIATSIGRPRAVRAVGAANGRNPLPIIIPCHRVIGANGSLTGFGGGLETKKYLLDLEQSGKQVSGQGSLEL
ncbi:MAG: methylated-DNA--[protein]-cysteine S-methyltransferase [Pseudomonadales bacterium]